MQRGFFRTPPDWEAAHVRAPRVERAFLWQVALPGFIRDRSAILKVLREAQVFVFCHKTPESPRNLIEALVS